MAESSSEAPLLEAECGSTEDIALPEAGCSSMDEIALRWYFRACLYPAAMRIVNEKIRQAKGSSDDVEHLTLLVMALQPYTEATEEDRQRTRGTPFRRPCCNAP
eukprot:TRINITY_DN2953_c0_g1_i1.p2 TRINITY_DN2953_c0_g1~~TRINITY_DN2953_c0_g1_i1.p2  ORF type:complete len:118 (-),score=18.54 TRINITY_DN2953_c0_g1_i1:2443-2754(-)